MKPPEYTIRNMSRDDLALAIDWAAAEGWNPGLQDADSFWAADPQGFLVGELDNEPVASISVVRYGEHFAFLGLYIVRPEFRGRGCGWRIWQEGIKRMAGRNIGLDGVVAQQSNYKKSGFSLAYRNIRYQGLTGGGTVDDPRLTPLSRVPFEEVLHYDRPFFPAGRTEFLRSWIHQPGCAALGMMEQGSLRGYGVLRPCRSGFKIGPLFADSPERADVLFAALTSGVDVGEPVMLDIPAPNAEAVALAERQGMTPGFETARMYTGSFPDLPLDRLFGVTSFELG